VDSFSDNPNIAIIVVGNKIDKERVVDREEGRKFARKHRALFIETSAKCDQFVSDAFRDIVEKVSSFLINVIIINCLIKFTYKYRLFHRNILATAVLQMA